MRKINLIGILVIVLFLLPMINTSSDYSPAAALSNPTLPQTTDNGLLADSGDHSSGVGAALPVTISGQVSNAGQGTLSFDSSSSGIASVTLDDGWTGTDLQAQIDSLTWTVEDVLPNGDLNDYHNEQFIITTNAAYNEEAHRVPDGWTLFKNAQMDDGNNAHPNHGVYELYSHSAGYGSTWGVRFDADWNTGDLHTVNDEIYFGQIVSLPWRQVYSAEITFRYYVYSTSALDDQVHLFVRLAGSTTKFHVFESGDTTDTWLTATTTIQAASMSGLSNKVAEFDIGLASDLEGYTVIDYFSRVHVDDVQVDFTVRPFPEQIDLKANGALVWGSTTHSVYPYVPDDANRDCYDDYYSGIDLDGYSDNGEIEIGLWSGTGYLPDGLFEVGMQFPIDIPQGAIVTSAYVEVEAVTSSSPYMQGMRIHVADEDNVSAFTTGSPQLEDRFSWIETSIDWYLKSWITSPDTRYRSPEIGPLVQNVVSRSGWSEGNYICLMLSHMYSDYYQRWNTIKGTLGYDDEHRARLFVEYVIPEPEDAILFFDYEKDITIDHNDVVSDLTDFPVLIDIIDSDLQDHVLSNGNDIYFTEDGTPVAHEIESYDSSTGHLEAWVKVPFLSSSTDTVITMHYGCLNAPSNLGSRVWDDYEIVQHLGDDPAGINYDSTTNNHDGTSYDGDSTITQVSGKIGDAVQFDGYDDVISVGQIYTDEWSSFTVSAWINHDVSGDDRIFSKAPSTTVSTAVIHLAINPSDLMRVRLSTDQMVAQSRDGIYPMNNGNWYYLTWTWDAVSDMMYLYVNGTQENSVSWPGNTVADSDVMFIIGNWETGTSDTRHYDGAIDEIRMLPTVRSAAWIETEFNNQNNPSGFYTVGTQEKTKDTWNDASEPGIFFTTSSPSTVTMDVIVTMDVGGEAQTMDTDFNEGVSYFIESGSNIVNWTAKVLVSPPTGATSFGFSVEYPRAEWKATKVLNPLNQPKTLDSDWWYHGGTLTLNASSIDFWGVWTLKFISWNFIEDVQLNNAVFDITDLAQFTVTTPTVLGARVGLDLVDPDGNTWYSANEQTSTDPAHRFPSFRYRKDITISSSVIYGDVTDFPVLIQFDDDNQLNDVTKVRADGSDILFADGDVVLDHEIEFFDQEYTLTEAKLTAWVKMNLTSGFDKTITMYYGSPIVDNLENPEGVWSSNFDAVWHLGEDVTDEAFGAIHSDSSGNGYDGVQNGNVEYASGRAGYAQDFDGTNDYISITDQLTPDGDVFITGWFRIASSHTSSSPNTQVIMEKYIDINHDMIIALVGQDYGQGTVPNGSLVFKVESSDNSAVYKWTQKTSWTAGWYFIGCYADEDDPSNNEIWVNQALDTDAGQVGSSPQANMSYTEEWQLGGGDWDSGSTGTGWFDGQLDEFRVSTILRTSGWLQTEYRNQVSPNTFAVRGSEQVRTSPDHTFPKTIDSTAPAGEWTAVVHYNDTGTTVTNKAGLFETTFVVRHPTTLTLTAPSDAVGDRLSVKTAGDSIIVEYELTDDITALGVPGATVTMNWSSPSTITLDDYGAGFYGKVLDTTNLGDNKQWRVEVQSSHSYYNDATEYFNIDLYHGTTLSAAGGSTTPADFIFNTTLTFKDDFTGAPITDATIVQSGGLPVSFTFADNNDGTYNLSIPTISLTLGLKQYTFNATKSGAYLHVAQVDVEFTLRAHYTSVSAQGDFTTPHGENTQVTIFLLDMDTGSKVSIAHVGTMTFSYSPPYADDTVGLYVGIITSNDWDVGTVTATLTITLSNARIQAPLPYEFEIEILAHATTVTVTGATITPYGNQTDLSIILTDLETGGIVPIGSVSNIRLQHPFGAGYSDFSGSYDIPLDTNAWDVGTWTVTVVITLSGTIYNTPSNYQFDITIRSMTSVMYTGPSALNFTLGSDFTVNLHLNVSEAGQYYGNPITGRLAGEFSVPSYTIVVDTSQQAIGLYKLTIAESYFTGGSYQITVYFTSADSEYRNTFLVIQFSYREIESYLSSPNYPQVTTPYQLNVEIILEFADADFGSGIEGAEITSPDHQSWIASWTDETGGSYSVWINVSTLAKGTHFISLTADKSGFTARTLQFRIVIRDAYTSVTPLVGSLNIPIGNSPFFYVDYIDLDRLLPIDNSTGDTEVVSDWGNFSVEYISEQYKITFHTSDSDTIAQNQVYTFTFSKANYQTVQFSITVTIRTHNTDFRIVSSIEPTSTIGIFNISVYYGDLDNTLGIMSDDVIFSVSNTSGPVISSYDYNPGLGDGFYIIQVPASQFGLGLQTLTVYADWTGAVVKYQDKLFVTSANVVGRESALTLLIGSEPTPYNEDMGYTFFYSDLFSGIGIDNLTNNVFIYVSFQGEPVGPSDIIITDFSATEIGKYSIEFNSGIFSRTGLIYMNVFVNWSKGVSPFYSNRTDAISLRILPRETLLSITPPSSTSYNENTTFSLIFEDLTGDSYITGLTKQEISLNISFSFTEDAGTYTISFNTGQFGSLGLKAILVDVTWIGSPFYANRTGRITYVNVVARVTSLEYITPPPTQYGDQVVFNVTWTDVTAGSSDPIIGATLILKEGVVEINLAEYVVVEIASGIYQVTLNTIFSANPGTITLRVEMTPTEFYYSPSAINRQFLIQDRDTQVAAEPVPDVPFGSSITITLSYLDLFTGTPIANDSAHSYPVTIEIMSPSGQTFTSTWSALYQTYSVVVDWDSTKNATWTPGAQITFTIRMSYDYIAPFYAEDNAFVSFRIRIRDSSLALDTEPETTPYQDDVSFIVFYSDDDSGDNGITGATISITGYSSPADFVISEDIPGYYTITFFSDSFAIPGTYILEVTASLSGAPYHDTASRSVSLLIRQRETNVEVTVPPSQTRYLDDVMFTFVYTDTDADTPITTITIVNVHLYWANGTEILSGFSINQIGSSFEVTISSTTLSNSPVTSLSLRIEVDWNDASAPFYKDDSTTLKVTITGRYMAFDTSQIDRTPKGDTLTITITLTDLDNGIPVEGAIILFNSPNGTGLVEGIHYDISEVTGVWTIDVYTGTLSGFGVFIFEVDVQWTPQQSPFYRNISQFTLSGLVDYVRTTLQASVPTPSSVQFTESLYVLVTYRDLDHLVGIDDVESYIETHVVYLVSRNVPSGLLVDPLGNGVYNVSFSTTGLSIEGSYSLEISAVWSSYAPAIVTPQFSVVAIRTALEPVEPLITLSWTETATILVDYQDLLHGTTISGVVNVSWSIGGVFGEYMSEVSSTGQYRADIDTTSIGAGSFAIVITATEDTYQKAVIPVTLVILTLPSDIVLTNPSAGFLEEGRGNPVYVTVKLNDTTWNDWINNIYVTQVFITFQGTEIDMSWDSQVDGGSWVGTITGLLTTIDPGPYDVRITARFDNYQLATDQFKLLIIQTPTSITILNAVENKVSAVYSEIVTFTLNFTDDPTGSMIGDATVWWYEDGFNGLNLTFSHIGGGIWVLDFNTSLGFYGTWGLTFRAVPDNPILAQTTSTITLTIKKIETEVITPPIAPEEIWGWSGNISFFYNDTWFDRGVGGADVTYDYGDFLDLPAVDLGNGTYLVFINTTYLTSGERHRIIVDFAKTNYEERTSGINFIVNLRPTVLDVLSDEYNRVGGDPTRLQIPMGDSFYVTFFYNDTSPIGGYSGGITSAIITENTLFAGTSFGGQRNLTLINLGDGHYQFFFDTMDSSLYEYYDGIPQTGVRYFFTVSLEFEDRESQEVTITIEIIEVPTDYTLELPTNLEMIHGDTIYFRLYVNDTWHNRPVLGASIIAEYDPAVVVYDNGTEGNGWYFVRLRAEAVDGSGFIDITIRLAYHQQITLTLSAYSAPNDTDLLVGQVTRIGLPISLLVITLLGLYVKVWSVPKRIRQINGQLKTLRKGKVPKPIKDVKNRQQLAAELFNDTFVEMKIIRTAAQMPEDPIPIEVPEMGELLTQLSILTHLNPEELDEFQADIAKMKMSEQAAFVKEVIMQEAIRAARRDGRTVEETLTVVEQEALRRLGGEEAVEPIDVVAVEPEERVFLEEEKKVKVTPKDEVKPVVDDKIGEVSEEPSDKMSLFEIEELRKDLERKGVPPHEIETIIEQAKELPRDLIDELVKSLERKTD